MRNFFEWRGKNKEKNPTQPPQEEGIPIDQFDLDNLNKRVRIKITDEDRKKYGVPSPRQKAEKSENLQSINTPSAEEKTDPERVRLSNELREIEKR